MECAAELDAGDLASSEACEIASGSDFPRRCSDNSEPFDEQENTPFRPLHDCAGPRALGSAYERVHVESAIAAERPEPGPYTADDEPIAFKEKHRKLAGREVNLIRHTGCTRQHQDMPGHSVVRKPALHISFVASRHVWTGIYLTPRLKKAENKVS